MYVGCIYVHKHMCGRLCMIGTCEGPRFMLEITLYSSSNLLMVGTISFFFFIDYLGIPRNGTISHSCPSLPWSAPLILVISRPHPTPPKTKKTHRHTHTCVQFVLSIHSLEYGQIPNGKPLKKNLVPTRTPARSHQFCMATLLHSRFLSSVE